jgi:hypothetical protein
VGRASAALTSRTRRTACTSILLTTSPCVECIPIEHFTIRIRIRIRPQRYQEETRKAIESINAVMAHLGAAALDLLTDRDKLLMLVAGGSALALGVYGARCARGPRALGRLAVRLAGCDICMRHQHGAAGSWMNQAVCDADSEAEGRASLPVPFPDLTALGAILQLNPQLAARACHAGRARASPAARRSGGWARPSW